VKENEMNRIDGCLAACPSELQEVLATAARAALAAGAIIRDRYGRTHQIAHKGAIDLVTEADLAAEEKIIDLLQAELPGTAILAEESSSFYQQAPVAPTWVIDPLDGTTNFAHGFPWFGTSIAFMRERRSEAGIIYCPMLDELFCTCRGAGAWLNGERVQVSPADALSHSLLATGFPYDIRQHPEMVLPALQAVLVRVQGVRRAGAAALDLAYVACGRLDGFWEIKLKPWDSAAGLLLVEEAGGRVTDFRDRPYSPFVPEILATNGLIHAELAALLQDFSILP
jgi:myo-inositol-1(or 4)-monophosphatase